MDQKPARTPYASSSADLHSFVHSPSIEELLSARSKRSRELAVNSVYSNLTTRTTLPKELDNNLATTFLSEATRLALIEEASAGLRTSPTTTTRCQEHFQNDEGSSFSPTFSESDYSPSLSVASVRMASRITDGGHFHNYERRTGSSADFLEKGTTFAAHCDKIPPSCGAQEQTTPGKRILNQRNLVIETALPIASASKDLGLGLTSSFSAEFRHPLTSRPALATSPKSSSSPQPVLPFVTQILDSTSRRSSQISYTTSSTISTEDDETPSLGQASLQRMQSFLGPKMTYISPAPWQIDGGDLEYHLNDQNSERSFWTDNDIEIGSVHMATKTPRSRSVKEAHGFAGSSSDANGNTAVKANLNTLKGLGLVVTTDGTSPAKPGDIHQESDNKCPSAPQPVDKSTFQQRSQRAIDKPSGSDAHSGGLNPVSPEPFSSLPPPSLPTTTVTNIVRSRSPDPKKIVQTTLQEHAIPGNSANSSKALNLKLSRPLSPLKPVKLDRRRSMTAEAVLLGRHPYEINIRPLAPSVSVKANHVSRKRAPVYQQESDASIHTVESFSTSSTKSRPTPSSSMASLPSPTPKSSDSSVQRAGMTLISLNDARERERKRIAVVASSRSSATSPDAVAEHLQAYPTPRAVLAALPLPPIPQNVEIMSNKGLRNKKSGFLKLFKHKEEVPIAGQVMPSMSASGAATWAGQARTDVHPKDTIVDEGSLSSFTSLPFPSQKSTMSTSRDNLASTETTNSTSRDNASSQPTVTFDAPSPEPNATVAFPNSLASHSSRQDSTCNPLVPSLSLRPVSMMVFNMHQDFLDDSAAMRSTEVHAGVSHSTCLKTPDGPSIIHRERASVVTPPPDDNKFPPSSIIPLSSSSSSQHGARSPFGLPPTPPPSAHSARTFPKLPQSARSPSSPNEAPKETIYREKILELEKLVMTLKVELDTFKHKQVPVNETVGVNALEPLITQKVCERCGCACKVSTSILARPRIIGHGNMFSSGRN